MEKYLDYTISSLLKLASISSPSGMTQAAISFVKDELNSIGVSNYLTNKGALVATFKGNSSDGATTLSAHVDTLGAMVKEIKASGRLEITGIGGYAWGSVETENCIIHSRKGDYTGTILPNHCSVHVYADAKAYERKAENMEVRLDLVTKSAQETKDLGISVGDFVSFDARATYTNTGFIKSRHLDDKASVAILLGFAKYIVEEKPSLKEDLHFFISNFEEIGHGACAGLPSNTKTFIAIDMGAIGNGQSSDEYSVSICAKDSSGPYDRALNNLFIELCEKAKIDYKVDIYPYYGSDASAALRSGYDIVAGLIGPGIDSSHSYERCHKDALLNTLRLLKEYITN